MGYHFSPVPQDLGAQVVIVLAESAQAAGLAQIKLPILELHPDIHVCGLFNLSLHGKAPPAKLQGVDVQHRERDDTVLLLQTSGTRCDPSSGPRSQGGMDIASN